MELLCYRNKNIFAFKANNNFILSDFTSYSVVTFDDFVHDKYIKFKDISG